MADDEVDDSDSSEYSIQPPEPPDDEPDVAAAEDDDPRFAQLQKGLDAAYKHIGTLTNDLGKLQEEVDAAKEREQQHEQLVDDLRNQISQMQDNIDGGEDDPFGPIIMASEGTTTVQWDQNVVDNGAIVVATGGLACTSDSDPSALIDPADTDTFFLMRFVDSGNVVRWVKISGGGSGGLGWVVLDQVGGGAGTAGSAYCSFTYDIYDQDGITLLYSAVAMTGNGQRTLQAPMTAATYGFGQDAGGTFTLLWADEQFVQSNCTAPVASDAEYALATV